MAADAFVLPSRRPRPAAAAAASVVPTFATFEQPDLPEMPSGRQNGGGGANESGKNSGVSFLV